MPKKAKSLRGYILGVGLFGTFVVVFLRADMFWSIHTAVVTLVISTVVTSVYSIAQHHK